MKPEIPRHIRAIARACGFTLIELMIAVAIVAVLVSVAVPAYSDYKTRVLVANAVSRIAVLNALIQRYSLDSRKVPDNLSQIGAAGTLDPWGSPYVYLNLASAGAAGKARKNKNLVPINSEFDLYSRGKDGASVPPLTAKPSRDDIVLANDGRFIGIASSYEP